MPKSVYIPKKSAKKPGRPTLLNPTRQASLLSAIEEGLPLKEAAENAGISYDTLDHWTNQGRRESAPPKHHQFCQLLQRSQAVATQMIVSAIREAAKRDWRAAAWIRERRFPADVARQQQIERSSPGGKPLISPYNDCEVLQRHTVTGCCLGNALILKEDSESGASPTPSAILRCPSGEECPP